MGTTKTTRWTPELRAQQSAAIQRWKPWEKSTGPRTERGKAASAANGWLSWFNRLDAFTQLRLIKRL